MFSWGFSGFLFSPVMEELAELQSTFLLWPQYGTSVLPTLSENFTSYTVDTQDLLLGSVWLTTVFMEEIKWFWNYSLGILRPCKSYYLQYVKGLVHPKRKILSSFTWPHFKLIELFSSSVQHKRVYSENCFNGFCRYNECQWGPKQHWTLITCLYEKKNEKKK